MSMRMSRRAARAAVAAGLLAGTLAAGTALAGLAGADSGDGDAPRDFSGFSVRLGGSGGSDGQSSWTTVSVGANGSLVFSVMTVDTVSLSDDSTATAVTLTVDGVVTSREMYIDEAPPSSGGNGEGASGGASVGGFDISSGGIGGCVRCGPPPLVVQDFDLN